MAGNSWIMTAYTDEADTSPNYVLDNQGNWQQIGAVTDAEGNTTPGDPTLINSAATYLDGAITTEEVRVIQGQFQQQYYDRDVRMERAKVTITYPAP